VILRKLNLYQFRNYERTTVEFSEGTNFIIGKNAQGKTNILESIYYASYGKSFRNNKDSQLVKEGHEKSYFSVDYDHDYGSSTIEVKLLLENKKEIRINHQPVKKTSEILGEFLAVIFSPDDLKIIKEGPVLRRRFLDREISQISRNYYHYLIQYQRVLELRNNYLKKNNEKSCDLIYLETINEQLIENGMKVVKKRIDYVEKLNDIIKEVHHRISEEKEVLKIAYVSPIIKHKDRDYDKIEEEYKRILNEKLSVDLKNNYTSAGPHRDEISILIDGKDLKIFGSQGQIRTATLSLVIGVMKITHRIVGEKPLLLLDDVFSELDDDRKNILLDYVKDYQTFITATDLSGIHLDKINDYQIYEVEEGKIRRRSFQ